MVALRSVSRSFRAWGARAKVTRPLHDGEELRFGDRTLEVQHRPGHSPSDTVFWDAERKILLCADHLIAHISSNPLISRPLDGSDERPHALMIYIESLRRTRELPAEILLPGHGEPITDHRALIDERFELHRRRAEKIHGPDRRAPAHRLRDRAGAVGKRRRDPGVPDPLRGSRPRRPARRRGARPRGVRRRADPVRGASSNVARGGGSQRDGRPRNRSRHRLAPRRARTARPLPLGHTKKRMLIIVNPYATTVSDRLKNLVVYALQGRYDVEAVSTEAQHHAIEIGREAREGGYDIVVAFGGDGTLNEVANGLAGTDVPGLRAPRRLHQRRRAHARDPQRRRRRHRAPARASPTTSGPAADRPRASPTGAVSCSRAAPAWTRPRPSRSTPIPG